MSTYFREMNGHLLLLLIASNSQQNEALKRLIKPERTSPMKETHGRDRGERVTKSQTVRKTGRKRDKETDRQ